MKKEKLIWPITIIVIALIFGFYFLQTNKQNINNNATEQSNISNLKNNNDSFSKKIECEKYRDKIEKKIHQYNISQKPEVRDSSIPANPESPINHLYIENNKLKEIFYSPKVNSCVYLESRRTLMKVDPNADPNIGDWGVSFETYYLIDALTNKEIDFNRGLNFLQIIHRSEQFTSEKDANNIINEYK